MDGTGVLLGVWFNQPYVAQRYAEGERVAFAGKIELDYGMKQIKNPFVEKLGTTDDPADLGRILPVHSTTEGITTNWMRRLVQSAIEDYGDVPDPLPLDSAPLTGTRVPASGPPRHPASRTREKSCPPPWTGSSTTRLSSPSVRSR